MRGALRILGLWIGGPLLVFGLVYLAVWARYRVSPELSLSAAQQQQVVGALRAALSGAKPQLDSLSTVALPGPLWVTLYRGGEATLRTRRDERSLRAAVDAAVRALGEDPKLAKLDAAARAKLRIKIDLAVAEGPLVTSIPLFFAKGIVPGLDGLGLEIDGKRRAYLLPDQLYKQELLAGYQPFFFMHEFKTGLDLRAAVNSLANELSLTVEAWRAARKRYFRFRVQSFVETPAADGKALPVVRHRVPVDRIDRATVRQAVVRAADYVLRQLQPNGRFHYIYYPLSDRHHAGGDYSLPRHAGTTWFLSLAYAKLREPRFKRAADRAIRYLVARAVPPSCRSKDYACVGKEGYADLGSAGLALVAIVEYVEATGDRRYLRLARRLGKFIMMMQKANGDFCHQYTPRTRKKNCKDILLYYAGEATLGLARLQKVTGDKRYIKPIERAMDFLVEGKYRFFLGKYFISEDHWTCIAAEAAYPVVKKREYLEFCREFAKLNRRTQVRRGEALDDLWGAFAITPFFMPHNTPVGSRSEANVGTYLLSQHWGEPDAEVRDTILSAMRYLVDQQIRPESAYLLPNPGRALGGLTQTPMRAQIRIDYVQHAAAAMVRALPLIPEKSWPSSPR